MTSDNLRRQEQERQYEETRFLLSVEASMTEAQKDRLLDLCFRLNPQLRGAHVADVLDMLRSTDASLSHTEPWWDDHGNRDLFENDAGRRSNITLYSIALYALIWSSPTPVWDTPAPSFEDVEDLAERARSEARLMEAKPFKCNCGKRFALHSEYDDHVNKHG